LDKSDKNCRHRGSDERDAPLLLDRETPAGDGDVVIGGEQGNQTEDKAADGLDEAEMVKIKQVKTETVAAGPGALQLW
jgi:hypothetical protein